MYEQKFGLSRRPFRANATGADVFVGPQSTKRMQRIRTTLLTNDAVVVVAGRAGVGKTTIVSKALDGMAGEKVVIRIARMQLRHDEVLDFLLAELGAGPIPASTIQKIQLFKQLLSDRQRAGVRVVIVVEDAVRLGEDALSELEVLTEAGPNSHDGAGFILMGNETLGEFLKKPVLERLNQRTRLRLPVLPIVASEYVGYLNHGMRLAGGEFDVLFAKGTAQMLFELSGGVPRVTNNLLESMVTAASEQDLARIDAGLVARVASEEYGLTIDVPPEPVAVSEPTPAPVAPEPAPQPEPEPAPEPEPEPAPIAEAIIASVPVAEPVAEAIIASVPVAEPIAAPVAEPAVSNTLPDLDVWAPDLAATTHSPDSGTDIADNDESIPTLESSMRIQALTEDAVVDVPEPEVPQTFDETIPKLTIPVGLEIPKKETTEPEAIPVLKADPEPVPELTQEPTPAPAVELKPEPAPALTLELTPESESLLALDAELELTPEPAPEPVAVSKETTTATADRDPTMAEFRPDMDALEEAMTGHTEPEPAAAAAVNPEPELVLELKEETRQDLPTITLDDAIEENIASATEEPAPAAPDPELQKIAADLAKAKSLEDVDDRMAETLFGAEISMIAAQVIAAGPEGAPENDELSLIEDTGEVPAVEESNGNAQSANGATESDMEREFKNVYGENALEVSLQGDNPTGGLDLNASQRLQTVRALNAEKLQSVGIVSNGSGANTSANDSNGNSAVEATPPDSIEQQITTSMTQTLRTLSARQLSAYDDDDDEEEEEQKGGFFSRFRRS